MSQIALFIDWQNTYKSAREAFGWSGWPNEYGNFNPLALGKLLARSNGRGTEGELVGVFIYRGLPSNRHDPDGNAANRRQSAAWMAEKPEVVIPKLRPLRYTPDGLDPREKALRVRPPVFHHELDEDAFRRVEQRINYAHRA